MGVFAEYQPRYAEHGVATFPLLIEGKAKKPATKGYAKTGLRGSGQLALKFPELDAFGFMTGKRSGVTILDIDDPGNEDLLRECLRRYGDTPAIVRTGSGGFHLYYRHANESRKIRPDPNMPVDLIGGGVAAAAPSKGTGGKAYELIRGTLDDLERLPYIRDGAQLAEVQETVRRELVQEGSRNKALMQYLRGQARYADELADLIDVARSYADEQLDRTSGHPFTDDEVQAVAKSVWDWTEDKIAKGQYFVGTGKHLILSHEAIDQAMTLGADAFMLFMYLKRRSDHRGELIVANGMAATMPDGAWTLPRFRKARQALIGAGVLKETRKASTWHGPATYAWQG